MRAKPKKFSSPVPVALDPILLGKIRELAKRMGEGQSTIMRQAMRLGLPLVEAELERLKPVYPESHEFAVAAEQTASPVSLPRKPEPSPKYKLPRKKPKQKKDPPASPPTAMEGTA